MVNNHKHTEVYISFCQYQIFLYSMLRTKWHLFYICHIFTNCLRASWTTINTIQNTLIIKYIWVKTLRYEVLRYHVWSTWFNSYQCCLLSSWIKQPTGVDTYIVLRSSHSNSPSLVNRAISYWILERPGRDPACTINDLCWSPWDQLTLVVVWCEYWKTNELSQVEDNGGNMSFRVYLC